MIAFLELTDAQLRSMPTSDLLMRLVTYAMVGGPYMTDVLFGSRGYDLNQERERICAEIDRRMPANRAP
jgi:hypothetical protein